MGRAQRPHVSRADQTPLTARGRRSFFEDRSPFRPRGAPTPKERASGLPRYAVPNRLTGLGLTQTAGESVVSVFFTSFGPTTDVGRDTPATLFDPEPNRLRGRHHRERDGPSRIRDGSTLRPSRRRDGVAVDGSLYSVAGVRPERRSSKL